MKQPHLMCSVGDVAENVIIVGDPERTNKVANQLDSHRQVAYNREFKSITGLYKGVAVSAVSTGIGGASTGIVIEELCNLGVKNIIRVGSCGAMDHRVQLGDLVVAMGAVRSDGTSASYVEHCFPAIPNFSLAARLIHHIDQHQFPHHCGIIRSHDSFYTDQEQEINAYWNKRNVIAADMETATLFVLGWLRGINTASVLNNVVLYQEDVQNGVLDYVSETEVMKKGEENAITVALESFLGLGGNNFLQA